MKLKIEYVDIDTIKPYKNNAKKHPQEQIDQIKKSIEQFGMDDPIGIWKDEIVEGHGRLIACKELGYTEVPIIRLDHLTDEERKAYTLAHNKLTMNSDFDFNILDSEIAEIDIDMSEFGFDSIDVDSDMFGTDFSLPSGDKSSLVNMVISLTQEQFDYIKEQMEVMKGSEEYNQFQYEENKNSNGNSIFLIVKQWEKLRKL